MFDKDVYISRRKQFAGELKSGSYLFLGNSESPMNYADNTYHFRQDSTFLYYFGINSPDLAAIIDLNNDKVMLFGDEMSIDDIVWMGRQKTLKEKADESGIDLVYSAKSLKTSLLELTKGSQVNFLPPYRADNKIRLAELLSVQVGQLRALASVPFIKAVVAQRSVKSELEIQEIHHAVSTSVDMQMIAMQMAKPGMKESTIAAALQEIAVSAGGNLAYPAILTVNGQILHNHYHGNILQEGDLVLNDSGAESPSGYAGDLTRTFPAGKV